MLLQEKDDIIAPNFKISVVAADGSQREFSHNLLNKFYHGHLADHPQSKVSATLDPSTGTMFGSIDDMKNDLLYYIEPASHLNVSSTKPSDSMVIYTFDKPEQIEKVNQVAPKFCGSINLKDDPQFSPDLTTGDPLRRFARFAPGDEVTFAPENLTFARPNRCAIRLVADTSFFQQMGRNIKHTVSYVISVIDRINNIYLHTNFGEPTYSDLKNFGFLVQEVQVLSEYSKEPNHFNSKRRGSKNETISKLLDNFSAEKSHKWFCLSHLFTHTQFQEGVLGLAYVANPRKAVPGGICSGRILKEGKEFYYNTGVTSTKNSFGNAIFTRITDLITAHELGHNWGAEHDPDLRECSPSGSEGGPYLMHTYSLNGYEANNKLFSPCSKRSIASVLAYRSQACFISQAKTFCGNGVVDENEECDAGHLADGVTPETGSIDPCCTIECKLKPEAQCSDLNNLCCENCRIRPLGALCRERNADTCKGDVSCDGTSKDCPRIINPLPDGQPCLDDGICSKGICQNPCERRGQIPCICHTLQSEFCLRCCRDPGSNGTCSPLEESPGNRLALPDGSPCIYGFCDTGKCKRAPQDVVKRLWYMIKSSSFNSFLKLMVDNLVVVAIIVLATFYIPLAIWLNSYDQKKKRKIIALSGEFSTNSRSGQYKRQGDRVEMQRLQPSASTSAYPEARHHYNTRYHRSRCDVPDEVDSNLLPDEGDGLKEKNEMQVKLPPPADSLFRTD